MIHLSIFFNGFLTRILDNHRGNCRLFKQILSRSWASCRRRANMSICRRITASLGLLGAVSAAAILSLATTSVRAAIPQSPEYCAEATKGLEDACLALESAIAPAAGSPPAGSAGHGSHGDHDAVARGGGAQGNGGSGDAGENGADSDDS